MGFQFLSPEELIRHDRHVIVDSRDGKCYESTKHDPMKAMAWVLDNHFGYESRNSSRFTEWCKHDMTMHRMRENGIGFLTLGDMPEPYFAEDLDIPETIITIGPLYMMDGCLCRKALDHAVHLARNILREKEKKEDLTPDEEFVAVTFNTHMLWLAGHEVLVDHSTVDKD
jgi:hypothetical protein